jgi:hypothetical protein
VAEMTGERAAQQGRVEPWGQGVADNNAQRVHVQSAAAAGGQLGGAGPSQQHLVGSNRSSAAACYSLCPCRYVWSVYLYSHMSNPHGYLFMLFTLCCVQAHQPILHLSHSCAHRAHQLASSQPGATPSTSSAEAAAQRAAHQNLCGAFDRWLAISPTPEDLHLSGPGTSSSTGGPTTTTSSTQPGPSSSNRHPAAVYLEQRQQWADAHLKQAALLGDVAQRMAAYAAARARAEGEVLRKQEAKLLGAPSRQQQQQQQQQQRGALGSPGRGAGDAIAPATRVLLHMDSQHQVCVGGGGGVGG